MQKRRFEEFLQRQSAKLGPYERPTDHMLWRAARPLTPDDVTDIIRAIEELTAERAALPQWDGDSSDAVAAYQETLARLLAATRGDALAALHSYSGKMDDLTRSYVNIARSASSRVPVWRRIMAGIGLG